MSSRSIEKFREYIEHQKDDFLRDGRRVEGIIRDIFFEEKSLIPLLTSAWKAGVVAELRQTGNPEVTIAQFADTLCQEYSLRESSALSAVRVWAYALRVTDVVPDINVSSTPSFIGQPGITAETKKCPFCAEEVKKDAGKCKHCHSDISDDAMVNGMQNNELKRQQEELKREKQKLERERRKIEKLAAIEAERIKLEAQDSERQKRERERLEEIEKKKLEAKRSELELKKKQLATGQRPSVSSANTSSQVGKLPEIEDDRPIFGGIIGAGIGAIGGGNIGWEIGTSIWALIYLIIGVVFGFLIGGYCGWEIFRRVGKRAPSTASPLTGLIVSCTGIGSGIIGYSIGDAVGFFLGAGIGLYVGLYIGYKSKIK